MVSFYDGTTLLGTAPLTAGTATFNTTSLTAGATNTLTATYSGDTNFLPSNTTVSTSVSVTPLDFTITLSGPANQPALPGQWATYEFVVNPNSGSYPGTVDFSVTGLPTGATATFNPTSLSANAGQQVVSLTIQAANPIAMRSATPIARKLAPLSLALLLLPFVGRQRRRLTRMLALFLMFAGIGAAAALTGCGVHYNPPQSYNITVTASSGSLQHSSTITFEVE